MACYVSIVVNADVFHRENDIEGIVELTFSVDDEKFGERREIDLMPGGRDIPVTNENKAKYVEYASSSLPPRPGRV